jgi:carboxypeptidase C (cathepsin A)
LPHYLQCHSLTHRSQTHICETTRDVKSYSGYVHLPPSILKDVEGPSAYNINTFFWFFEARHDPDHAPLSIYLPGGPGESSIFTAANGESGPCIVNRDSNSTVLNPWSFNNHVNMLYIDQPNQVGFSYDELVNGTFDVAQEVITPADSSNVILTLNTSMLVGTFPSQDPGKTANNTVLAARVLWYFAQSWFTEYVCGL